MIYKKLREMNLNKNDAGISLNLLNNENIICYITNLNVNPESKATVPE